MEREFFECLNTVSKCKLNRILITLTIISCKTLTVISCKTQCFSYVCSICACLDLLVSSSFRCLGRAAVCDCGTPWTFLLHFFPISYSGNKDMRGYKMLREF